MRILVLQPTAREQHVFRDQRVDDGLVGVALLAVVVDDARSPTLAIRSETRRVLGEVAGVVHREGDRRVDAARAQFRRRVHPSVEIFATVTGGRMYKARTCIVRDMVTSQHGTGKKYPSLRPRKGWAIKSAKQGLLTSMSASA